MNANTLATEEGAMDTSRLFSRLEERTRQVLGEGAMAEQIGRALDRPGGHGRGRAEDRR